MSLFIVRTRLTHELVGIYAAANTNELCDLADEICTPSACQYTALPFGGFGLPQSGAPRLPFPGLDLSFQSMVMSDGELDKALERLRPTAGLMAAFCDDMLEWLDLDPEMDHPGSQRDAALAASRSPLSITSLHQV